MFLNLLLKFYHSDAEKPMATRASNSFKLHVVRLNLKSLVIIVFFFYILRQNSGI